MTNRHGSRTIRTTALGVGALLALTALTSCTSGPEAAVADDRPPVIAPGRPGEDARTLSPEEAQEAADAQYSEPNRFDMDFMSMMIVHHQQALEMAGFADGQAGDPRVQRLAARIAAAQAPEIAVMEVWLDRYGTTSGHGHEGHHGTGRDAEEHDHADMPGMATPEQLTALAAADGTDFDRLFLDLMIVHHEGAVTMSADVLADGAELTVSELATEMAAQQSAEIGRMRALLNDL